MLEFALPIIIIVAVIAIIIILSVTALYIWSRHALDYRTRHMGERLKDMPYMTADGGYYDHRIKKRHWIKIKGNLLTYTIDKAFLRPEQKFTINLNHIKIMQVYFFTIFIQTNNGAIYKLPTGFHDQAEIYTALKYHRTSNGRRMSTR